MTKDLTKTQLDAIAQLQKAFPRKTLAEIVRGPLAQHVQPKEKWANLKQHRLVDTEPANLGSCVMCLYLDGPRNEVMIVIGERPDPKNPERTLYNGSGGGFGNLMKDEQPADMAAREWGEENKRPNGRKLFSLDPAKMKLIDIGEGVDYRSAANGGLPTGFWMHSIWLDQTQKKIVKLHAANMEDEAYRKACYARTKFETKRMRVMRLEDAAAINMAEFAHPHECKAIRHLQKLNQAGLLVPAA